MNRLPKAWCLLAGLAILATAPAAFAAKPTQTPQQRKASIDLIKQNHKQFSATQPRTMAQGAATQIRMADGATAARVPTELWNHLSVQKDAQGNLHQVESSDYVAPNSTWEGLDNE